MENWQTINNFEDYQVSNLGFTRIIKNEFSRKERILKSLVTRKGYFRVALYKDKKPNFKAIHRLVAEAFIPNPDNKPFVNHIDGDKSNNHVDNLEWCTYRENIDHAIKNNLSSCGERNGRSKLTIKEVIEIRENSTLNQYELAEKYSVSQGTINRIKNNKGWKL